MASLPVRFRIDRHSFDVESLAGLYDPAGDFTAIGYQDLAKQISSSNYREIGCSEIGPSGSATEPVVSAAALSTRHRTGNGARRPGLVRALVIKKRRWSNLQRLVSAGIGWYR
jgi:hypothetical protein